MIKIDGDSKDTMEFLTIIVVIAATVRFLLEGLSIPVFGHQVDFGHIDSATYGMFLAPILGAHGYMKVQRQKKQKLSRVDNPDAEE